MNIDIGKHLPKATNNKNNDNFDNLLYTVLVEWKWDYETFKKTPITVLMRCMKVYNKIKKEEEKRLNKK